jgi:hypothetical protein
MHSRPLVISAASAITPARCGSSRSKLIPCWHDKHSLTCDNDTADSWDDGWTRQPPIYQESLLFPAQHASHLPEQTQIVTHAVHCHRGLVTITKYGSDPIQSDTASAKGHFADPQAGVAEQCVTHGVLISLLVS